MAGNMRWLVSLLLQSGIRLRLMFFRSLLLLSFKFSLCHSAWSGNVHSYGGSMIIKYRTPLLSFPEDCLLGDSCAYKADI